MDLGKYESYPSMERASERFVEALLRGDRPAPVQNVEARLPCDHDSKHAYRYADQLRCRICKPRAVAERRRDERLPDMIENTRDKLARLEREARRKGLIR